MVYDDAFLKQMKLFGLLKYDLKRILSILYGQIDAVQFKQDFADENSDVYKNYHNGKDSADFAIDKALFDLAIKGDVDAITKLEEMRADAKYNDMVKEIYGNE